MMEFTPVDRPITSRVEERPPQAPRPKLSTVVDERLENLKKVVAILEPLAPVERDRIIRTVVQFYNVSL